MFDFIRNHQKLMQFVLLLFITPAFVLFGLEGYKTASSDANAYAKVGDYVISPEEFDAVKRQRIEEMRAQSGASFDPKLFDSPEVNRQLLDSLVLEYVLQQSVQKQFLTASDFALREQINKTPFFQKDGKFDLETYKLQLSTRGVTPVQHEANVRFGMARNQVLDPVLQSVFFSDALRKKLDETQLAGRVLQFKLLNQAAYLSQVQLAEEQLSKYYDTNKAQFMTLHKADVEFVVLSPEDVQSSIEVSDADARSYYDQNKARFSTPEERRARHILLDASKAGEAEKVLLELKANRAKFAELAKQYSTDTASAEQGGDLGFFGKTGAMVSEFEHAVFALKKGDLSGLVKTQFGYHIIEVMDVRGGVAQPLDAVKAQIVAEIKSQKATAKIADAQGRFSELVYEGGQSFGNVEKALGAKPVKYQALTQPAAADAPAVLKDPKVLAEVFSDSTIQSKNNTKAMQVGDALVSVRIVNYTPATAKPFVEVRSSIQTKLKQEEALKLVSKDAEALVAQLNAEKEKSQAKAPDRLGLSEPKTISILGADSVPVPIAQAALKLGQAELPKAQMVSLGGAGYAVVWVSSSAAASDVKAKADPQLVAYFEGLTAQAYQEALLLASRDAIKNRVKVDVKKTF